ncbi:hypothetical protein RIF29_16855 [Crotalaria pallida]|uniref:ZC3H15/TMA46 family C-terminal domain-containing protein n=1 Tax=Crotalaria pallida TaxID=3830 RepID=A0AAN9FPG6_CROPI
MLCTRGNLYQTPHCCNISILEHTGGVYNSLHTFWKPKTMGAEAEEAAAEKKLAQQRPTPTSTTTLTQDQFLSWKRQKDEAASARKSEASRKREEDIAAGTVLMNGRELFLHEPWVFDNSLY